jgi:glycosyltransferase involved in cell wall biosynthesis
MFFPKVMNTGTKIKLMHANHVAGFVPEKCLNTSIHFVLFSFLCSVKVLILHQHFNTPQKGGAIRSYYLAQALRTRNITPIVITAHGERVYRVEYVDGIEIHYLPIAYNNRFGFYKRGIAFIRYAVGALRLMRRMPKVDLCYAISVPLTVGLAAVWIKRRYSIPFDFEVGDLWPDAPVQLGFIQSPILRNSLYKLEKRIYHQARNIVALSPMIQQAIERKIPGKKVSMIPNMADTEFYFPEPKDEQLVRKFNVEGKFVVSYVGAIGYANGLDYFLECARSSGRAGLNIQFLLCGDGALVDHLKSAAKQLQLKNLSFIPFQNRDGVRDVLNITDANFICYRPVSILETGSPNKYFDGLAAGKLIVINFGGWIREEMEARHCGIYTDPRNPVEFADKIAPFVADRNLLLQYQKNARKLAEERYSRSALSQRFLSVITD